MIITPASAETWDVDTSQEIVDAMHNCADGDTIFIRNGICESAHAHYTEANANLPRYFYNGPRSDLPEGKSVTIHSEIVWETRPGYNVFGFIRGTDPVFYLEKEELVIISANLDSFGEVPELSVGARGAANCAGILKLAEYLHYQMESGTEK